MTLHRHDWEVGIVETMSGKPGIGEDDYLLLRPWAARNQPFDLQNGSLINATNPLVLNVGGPLTNSVAAGRHGRSLNLSYRLLGAGGEPYQLIGARRQPEIVAYRADQKIASGKSEFG